MSDIYELSKLATISDFKVEAMKHAVNNQRSDSYMVAFTETVNFDAAPVCRTGKPCKTRSGRIVCIPKNQKCRSQGGGIGNAARHVAGIVGTGLATGAASAVGFAAADRLMRRGNKSNSKPKKITQKVEVEIRNKPPEERTPEEKETLRKNRAHVISRLASRKVIKSLGLEASPDEVDFIAKDLEEIMVERRKKPPVKT